MVYTINATDMASTMKKSEEAIERDLVLDLDEDVASTSDVEVSTVVSDSTEVGSEIVEDSTEIPTLEQTLQPSTLKLLKPTSKNESDWYFGPSRFVEYMNTKYRLIQLKRVSNPKKRIVYEKKGTTGMAGQMFGVCDTLLLGILHSRAVQCILRVFAFPLVWAPALREEMFDFPLSNFTYKVRLPRGIFNIRAQAQEPIPTDILPI